MLRVIPSHLIPNFLHTNMKLKKTKKEEHPYNLEEPKHQTRGKIPKKLSQKKKKKKSGNIIEIGKFIRRIMIHFDLPTSAVNHMIEKINQIVKNHMKHVINNISKYHEQEKYILRAEYKNKEEEFKQKLMEVDKFLNEETKRIEKEHKKLVYLTESMVSNEKKLSEKSREMENKLKKINELEIKLAGNLQCSNKNKTSSDKEQHLGEPCKLPHCNQQCEENLQEIEQLKIQRSGFEKVVENQNTLIVNLTAKSNIMYKQIQDNMVTIENLNKQIEKQKALLEIQSKREQLSERTISSSEALTVGTDGEGDHNIEEAIKESHFKLEQLEMESNEIERKFQRFRSTLRHK
ncbi:spindle assembly checkpoint component MAD1 isoform X2 [Coccinella septempunctata]|uniref:spindle assembly checkpoint component MAD1 isoform X2 n=1 Tax=Coccinella septempunctata TaxID=41139 RepID=UPI001D0914FF|nr:spindle assembly checkpoint component MAD1 isoform X2 [Coccinella septempunctata]